MNTKTICMNILAAVILTALPASAETAKQNGISYVTWWSDQYSKASADVSLAELADTGASWISLLVTAYQENISSTTMSYSPPRTPTDADLVHVIGKAHSLGLKVMLKPHVDLASDTSHWRGDIGTTFTDDTQWADWFASYKAFIFHYADLARSEGADQFCVGTELVGTEKRETQWREVIASIREKFNGPLVYASNHGEEAKILWWDALDLIGVDAYYPLTNKNDPTIEELKSAWAEHAKGLAELSAAKGKKIIFTEVGYRSIDGVNQRPWDWQASADVDLQEQADIYRAMLEIVYREPWFGGLFLWSWGTNPNQGGPTDRGYTIHGKPAEDVIREWFSPAESSPPSLQLR